MIISSNIIGIVADDLTGANDTALQFKLNGVDTNILLDKDIDIIQTSGQNVWAISTESRNIQPQNAFEKVKEATNTLIEKLNPDYFYKKIDSTVRGNIAVEVLSMLEALEWDCALIIPAFPQEGRITVGGYHLLNGVPIERTEMARDPHSPIFESHLPTMLKKQLGPNLEKLVSSISLRTVMRGAGPILQEINELIAKETRIIIADAISETDISQIVLAMQKSNYKILPVGTAATGKVLSNEWLIKDNSNNLSKFKLPKLPQLILSGSATEITHNQIIKFANSEDYKNNSSIIELTVQMILAGVSNELVNNIVTQLQENKTVLVHTSNLLINFDGFSEENMQADLSKSSLADAITDFLSELAKEVLSKTRAILITLGGETSYKCCNKISANQLQILDEVLPAIALSKNVNSEQYIVTKSGNLGNPNTIIEILNYFKKHEE